MTSLLFWIACLLVQKSACLATETFESTSFSSQTIELSNVSSESELTSLEEAKHNPSNSQVNEAPLLTTSVNDIECSNTEGCASPINLFNTPTIIPVAHSKITWQPITNKRISTEATPTNTDAIPFRNLQYNTSKANDDGGNELDSEVKDMKANFLTRMSTVMPTDKFENPTNPSIPEVSLTSKSNDSSTIPTAAKNVTVGTLVQIHTESTSTFSTDNRLAFLVNTSESQADIIPHTLPSLLEHNTKDTVLDMAQDYATPSIPSKMQSISTITTSIPISLGSSVYADKSSAIPAGLRNSGTFQGDSVIATTHIPDVFTTEISNEESNLSDDMKNILQDSKSSIMAEQSESNMTVNDFILPTSENPINLILPNISAYPRLLEAKDESKFETTTMPYADTEKSEIHTNPSTTTVESLMISGSHLQMHSIVNVSYKDISEGHGSKRNLSHHISSSDQSFMTTELQNDNYTESYSTKDNFTTNLSEATTFSNLDETQFSTITPENIIKADMFDNTTTKEKVYSNFSEVIESSTSVVETERLMVDTDKILTLSPTINEASMNDKEVEVTSLISLLPKSTVETYKVTSEGSALTTEVPITEKFISEIPMSTAEPSSIEKIISENFISTTETPYIEKEISISSSTFESKLEMSSEFVEISGRSNSRVSTILNDAQFTTKQFTDPSSSSAAYYSTTPYDIHFRANDVVSATATFLLSQDVPTVPVTTLPKQFLDETRSTRTFEKPSSTSSIEALSSTQFVTVHYADNKEDSRSTTLPPLEQTASAPPTPLTYQQTTPTPKSYSVTTFAPKTHVPTLSIDSNSVSTQEDTSETYQLISTTNSAASDYSMDQSASTTVIPILETKITTTSKTSSNIATTDTSDNIMTTIYHLPSFATDSPGDLSTHSPILTTSTTKKDPEADATVVSTTLSNIPFYSTLSTTETVLQSETRRGGKHIPFSTASTRKEAPISTENGIIRITSTDLPVEDESQLHGYSQMQFDELSLAEQANVITATILLPSKHLNEDEMHEKMMKVHSWLLHVLMKEFQNWTRDPFEESEDSLNASPFGNISIFYISPTPEMNSSGITLTFIVYNVWKNETLQVDFVLGILNYYSKELKESVNATAAYFYHGYVAGDHYLMSAILERYGVIIVTICLAVVLILLLVCVVIFYRKKTRRSVHCLSNSKFKQNIHEAVGIDLNPAIVILQDEKNDKVGNGNKICDDEGWLAPINDVPQAEDTNVPFIQDTKL